MRTEFFPDTRTLYIELADRPSTCSEVLGDAVVVDLDADGLPVGVTLELGLIGTDGTDWVRVEEACRRLGMKRHALQGMARAGLLNGTFYRTGLGRNAPVLFNVAGVRERLVEQSKRD